jgi:2',3'-cyclic-nucleotide 2'-phosphodiesterase (5'-nucleotidase family)
MGPRLLHYSDLEAVFDSPERVARLAGLIAELRDEETLVVGTGDNTAPGVLSLATEGRAALPFFEAVGPAADTFGNHDFDYGPAALRGVVADSPQIWLTANVTDGGDPFGADAGVRRSATVEAGDARVGLTGLTPPDTAEMSPAADGLAFADPVSAVSDALDGLEDVDYRVVLSHAGVADDDIARRFDLDAVLGGHLHSRRAELVAGTMCTRPGANGHRLLEVDLADGSVTQHDVADGPVLEALLERYRAMQREAGLEEVVATVEEPISREREVLLGGECRAGNFVTDAYRWAAGTELALHNAGGIREGPALSGAVTVADLVSLVPFDEPVAVVELTGEELRSVVTEAYERRDGEARWNAYLSGLTVRFDTGAGEPLSVRAAGRSLNPTRRYRLATNDYLLGTPHEFPTITESHRVDTLTTQYEVLADYARSQGIAPELEGRVTLV